MKYMVGYSTKQLRTKTVNAVTKRAARSHIPHDAVLNYCITEAELAQVTELLNLNLTKYDTALYAAQHHWSNEMWACYNHAVQQVNRTYEQVVFDWFDNLPVHNKKQIIKQGLDKQCDDGCLSCPVFLFGMSCTDLDIWLVNGTVPQAYNTTVPQGGDVCGE